MSLWSDFYSLVMPEVPGITTAYADRNLRMAAADYFERTKSYVVDLTTQTAVINQSDYTFNLPTGTDLVKIQSATINGQDAGTELQFQNASARTGIYALSPTRYRVYPTPSAAVPIIIRASIKPGATSTGIPDEYFSTNDEAIAWGAIARMLASPKKPWTDINLAGEYASQFARAIAEEQAKFLKSYGKSRLRATACYF